jgi:Na+-transporting methylmalonyl-CoA/oxaloacetate decarboxylase gamma subunit
MDDSFSFGEPAKKWSDSKVAPRPLAQTERVRPPIGPMLMIVGVGVVLVLAVAFFTLVHHGGQAAARSETSAVAEAAAADDTQARSNLQTAQQTASMLYAEGGPDGMPSYLAADAAAMVKAEPSLQYVTGSSTGPNVVSVAATSTDWGAAVLSASGTCFYVHLSAQGARTGTGPSCTGQAALSANG